jgi:tetratricopeptide (TPR) repeat protein
LIKIKPDNTISVFSFVSLQVKEMRNYLRASIICIIVGLGFQVPATPSRAQSARDIMNIFGAIVQSTMVQATQAEWKKLPPNDISCVDQTLRQRGISLQVLISSGIIPSDNRISEVLASCRFQSEVQQSTNLRLKPTTEFTRTASQPSKYSVDKISLSTNISLESANYKEYQCKPSDQFPGFTWCQKQRTERAPRGAYLSSYSLLHTAEGRVFYVNRYLEPAFFKPGEVNSDIDRLARRYGEQPRFIQMPQRNTGLTGVIAYWGDVILEPLDARASAALASGHSPGGILLDSAGDFQESIRQGLPIYKVTGGAGYVWVDSHDANGRGRLRFFAIDPSALSSPSTVDPWKDCQSQDADTRLVGCTKVIEAKGPDRIRLADAFDGRCSAYNQKQQFQPALSDCKTAVDLNPRYSYAYANLGATYLGMNDSPSALSALNKAVALKSNFLWSRLSRARAFEAAGSSEEALKDYEYALLIDAANQQAREGVARLIASTTNTQSTEFCVRDATEQAQYIAVSANSSASGIEGAISTIYSTAQIYKTKLNSVMAKIDDLGREKDASEKKQTLIIGSAEERKRTVNDVQRLTEAASESEAKVNSISAKISEQESKRAATEASNTGRAKENQPRLKEIRQQLTKLRSGHTEAERELHQKVSERDDAISKAQYKGPGSANRALKLESRVQCGLNSRPTRPPGTEFPDAETGSPKPS